MSLAVVRDRRAGLRLETAAEVAAFEEDLLAEFVLARSSAGVADATIRQDVATVCQLREWFGRPLWELRAADVDGISVRTCARLRRQRVTTRRTRSPSISSSFKVRYKPAIHAATGFVVGCRWMRSTGPAAASVPGSGSRRHRGRLAAVRGVAGRVGEHLKDAPSARNYTACRLSSLIGRGSRS